MWQLFGTLNKRLTVAIPTMMLAGIAFGPAGSDAALVIAMAYIIQVQSAAWYVKLTTQLFGPAEPEPHHV